MIKVARAVEARLKLRARFLHVVEATPSIADDRPMGSGTTNRHGMPRLPPGQYETTKMACAQHQRASVGDDGALALACCRGRVFTVGPHLVALH
jgi:hypothetical protein